MLRTTQPPARAAVTTEHPLATAGRYLTRYGLVVVIAWIGALRYARSGRRALYLTNRDVEEFRRAHG